MIGNCLIQFQDVLGRASGFASGRERHVLGGEGEQFLVLLHAFMVPSDFILVQDAMYHSAHPRIRNTIGLNPIKW